MYLYWVKHIINKPGNWLSVIRLTLLLSLACISKGISAQTSSANFDYPDLVCEEQDARFTNTSFVASGDTPTYQWYFQDARTEYSSNPIANWQYLGNTRVVRVTLTMYLQNGDSSVATKNVSVNSIPVADFSVSDDCEGTKPVFINQSTTHYKDSLTYFWEAPGIEIDSQGEWYWPILGVTRNEVIKLIAVSLNGCTDTVVKLVTIQAIPDASFDLERTGVHIEVSAKAGYEIYQWRFGEGGKANTQNASYVYNDFHGTYEVCLSVKNSYCWAESCQEISRTTNIIDLADQTGIEVYPNPTAGEFNIKLQKTLKPEIAIYDLKGRTIGFEMSAGLNGEHVLAIDAQDGVYILQVTQGQTSVTKRITVIN